MLGSATPMNRKYLMAMDVDMNMLLLQLWISTYINLYMFFVYKKQMCIFLPFAHS